MWGGGFPAQGEGPRQEWVDFAEMKKAARWRPQKSFVSPDAILENDHWLSHAVTHVNQKTDMSVEISR